MSADSPQAFSAALRKASLLTPAQSAKLSEDMQRAGTDARGLARRLLERGWLTTFQVNQVFLGRGAELRVGPYILLDRLGEGGTGHVFKALHEHMNRIVALKLIRKELLADQEVVSRFHREVQLASSLTHPNIVHAYDAGPVGSNYFLVMEFVEGVDLGRLVKQAGPLPVEQACTYICQAAAGLQHIHERGLVHRDIKPQNLFVTGGPKLQTNGKKTATLTMSPGSWGVVKILDLGLARLHRPVNGEVTGDVTKAGSVVMGTLDYMAPEQAIDFHHADIRADIYSLGCAFYHLLTGHPPFPEGTLTQKLLRHQQAEPAPVNKYRQDFSAAATAVLRKMMAKKPEDRFQTPMELVRQLVAAHAHLGSRAPLALTGPDSAGNRGALVVSQQFPLAAIGTDSSPRSRPTIRRIRSLVAPGLAGLRKRPRLLLAGIGVGVLLLGLLILPLMLRQGQAPGNTASGSSGPPDSSAKSTFLSDLPELNIQGAAFAKDGLLGHNGNGNIGGDIKTSRIIVNGIVSRKGISMLAPSQGFASVSFRLNKQYAHFKSTVALHDKGWFSGSTVRFSLIGDGKVIWQSKPIRTHQEYPEDCSASVAGVDLLELQVTCTSSNNGVWPVWIDPVVSK